MFGRARVELPCRFASTRIVALSLLLTTPSFGQSAADKATARELAAAGIQDLEKGNAASAEEHLSKAQALYDAPVHLLYLARAQVQQGKLVEASENYRTLLRANLSSDAPRAFVQAKKDGEKELNSLEPRLARLTIQVSPAGIDGLVVRLNDETVNTAGLSTSRPANPGKKSISASAPGYEDMSAEVELSEGGSESVQLTLTKLAGEITASSAPDPNQSLEDEPEEKSARPRSGSMGFIGGVRLGGVLPVGDLSTDSPMSDFFLPGVGVRGELGFRFARYFAAKGFVGLGSFAPGNALADRSSDREGGVNTGVEGLHTSGGFSLLATTEPRILGGFAEVGFVLFDRYDSKESISTDTGAFAPCENRATFTGRAVRLGGGMNIPLTSFLNIVPTVDVEVGQSSQVATVDGCADSGDPDLVPPPQDDFKSALHYQIFLGIGADFLFGDSWFD